MTVKMERYVASQPDKPVVHSWSVASVKNWTVTRTTHEDDVAIRVEGKGFSEIVSYRDPINSLFRAPTGYTLEQREFAGKPLSEKAAEHLSAQILVILTAVQREERAGGEAAVIKLVAAGATVSPYNTDTAWRVGYKGGSYTLWGCVDGKNKMSGMATLGVAGTWVETTTEELIAKAEL
jgi:hypothetical protein